MPDGPRQARTSPKMAHVVDRPLLPDAVDEPRPPSVPESEDDLPPAKVASQRRSLTPPARRAVARSRALMRPCHAAHLASRMTPQLAILLEPSTGAAALPAAAWNLAPSAHVLSAGGAWRDEQQDLLDDARFH